MEHMKELHSGEQAGTAVSVQAEQILSLLERRGIVEDQSITSKRPGRRSRSCVATVSQHPDDASALP